MPLRTVRLLNRLIRTCRDGEGTCRAWSEAAESPGLRELLTERSEEWARQGDELQALVLILGGRPALSGTPAGELLRGWVTLKALLLGRSDLPVLVNGRKVACGALRGVQRPQPAHAARKKRGFCARATVWSARRLSAHHHRLEDLRGYFAAQSP